MGLRQSLVMGLADGRGLIPTVRCTISPVVITDTLIQTSDLMIIFIMAANRYLTARGLGSVLFSCVSTLHFRDRGYPITTFFSTCG
jgi:hypothetical protein